jgi:hypothetical protein
MDVRRDTCHVADSGLCPHGTTWVLQLLSKSSGTPATEASCQDVKLE